MRRRGVIAAPRQAVAAGALDNPRTTRSRGRAWALRLTLGFCASLAVFAAAPAGAGACASLAGVKSFHGQAHMVFGATATGEGADESGIEDITLNRVATGLKLNLDERVIDKKATAFSGTASGGTVSVGDNFSGADGFSGQESYDGPVKNGPMGYGAAQLTIDHRKGMCRYEIVVGYGVTTEFSGDEEVKPPPTTVGASASSGSESIPDSLKLSDSRPLLAVLNCPVDDTVPVACFDFSGGWTTEFGTLALCHSVEAVNCASPTEPVGSAKLSWSLSPTFEKHHKKK